MIPRSFDYEAPKTISEAVALLKKHGEGAKVLAGGQSLIPLMKLRLASPELVVDINRIPGLDFIKEEEGYLRLGSLTRMADVEESDVIRRRYTIISEAASQIADPLVRNLGTVGGNLAHGDPGNDLPSVMLALDGIFVAEGEDGKRSISAREFYVDTFVTALEPDELLAEIQIKEPDPTSGGAYLKLERRVGDFAIVGVATQLTIGKAGVVVKVGVGLTGVGPTVLFANDASEYLKGKELTDKTVDEAAEMAAQIAQPTTDLRGSKEYKRSMVKVMTRRALRKAYDRAKSEGRRK
jgi:carbon-monoxide dehydrogenase medium subunit